MVKKPLALLAVGMMLWGSVAVLHAQADYQMLSVTEEGRYFKYRFEISDWQPGEHFINFRAYYLPWQGEDSLDYEITLGQLKVNGEIVGVDLVEKSLASLNGKSEKIVTVQTDPEHLDEAAGLPNLMALTYVDVSDEDLEKLSRVSDLRALDLAYTKTTDAGVEKIADLNELRVLNLSYTKVTDEGLKHLSGMTKLHTLDLENTLVTDEGVKELANLDNLTTLNLFRTPAAEGETLTLRGVPLKITDEGLKSLAGMGKLTELNLHGAAISDEGIKHLANLGQLARLDLRATEITDESLVHLSKLKNLRILNIKGTKISAVGVAQLRKALPDCEISY